ncbi:hypothetical protein VPHD520_0106 [Vibrio phage D520]
MRKLPFELNPYPELYAIWEHYQGKSDLDKVIVALQENLYHLPPLACKKRLQIALTIKTQRLLHGN